MSTTTSISRKAWPSSSLSPPSSLPSSSVVPDNNIGIVELDRDAVLHFLLAAEGLDRGAGTSWANIVATVPTPAITY